ncbi:thrombomodulin-like, partial [Oxyura jamaicensis]|uniref:thrombomodulin-like n=1 Tax=Oxyura jamaicensis TaxID=8884 RepID=UPI0015A6E831
GRPSCSCPAGKALGPDGRSCASPCAGAPCQHHCVPNGDTFLCMCEAGYQLAPDGSSCEDVDDCAVSPGLCEQACLNTEGGFECRCHHGYEMVEGRCQPVSSCYAAPCEHRCEDVPGGYHCSCMPGYAVHPQEPARCVLYCDRSQCPAECNSNTHSCYCPEGFVLDESSSNDTVFCVDIDECEMDFCDHNCTNQPGSYACHCSDGYVLVDRNHCQETQVEDGGGSSGDFELWTPVPSRGPPKTEHLHPGALVGITVGVLCAALVLLAVGYHLAKKRCRPPASMDYKCGSHHEKEVGLQQVTAVCAASGQKL